MSYVYYDEPVLFAASHNHTGAVLVPSRHARWPAACGLGMTRNKIGQKTDRPTPSTPIPMHFFSGRPLPSQGALNPKKRRALARLVGSPEAKKVPGLVRFSPEICFYSCFLLLSPRTPKNAIKENREKYGFGFFVDFFVKTF
jgi:hypothetical protein